MHSLICLLNQVDRSKSGEHAGASTGSRLHGFPYPPKHSQKKMFAVGFEQEADAMLLDL